jgi:hypothetical protein
MKAGMRAHIHHAVFDGRRVQMREWVPSQNGGFLVCLQPQKATRFFSVNSTSIGENDVPVCEPSQKGCVLDLPQRHQENLPGPISIT